MLNKRLTCLGQVKDLVLFDSELRLFWMNYTNGSWILMARDMSDEGDNEDILKESMIFNAGEGIYKGLDFVGSKNSYWYIVYSLNYSLFLIKLSGEADSILFFEELWDGVYPFIFRNDSLELYALLYYDLQNHGWRLHFSGNMKDWSMKSVSVNEVRTFTLQGFENVNYNINLTNFLNILKAVNEFDIGRDNEFLL